MNGIVNTLLLARDKFISEMNLKQPGFIYSACGTFTKNKTKKEYKNFKKQQIYDIFIKTNSIKLISNLTWLMEILKI